MIKKILSIATVCTDSEKNYQIIYDLATDTAEATYSDASENVRAVHRDFYITALMGYFKQIKSKTIFNQAEFKQLAKHYQNAVKDMYEYIDAKKNKGVNNE